MINEILLEGLKCFSSEFHVHKSKDEEYYSATYLRRPRIKLYFEQSSYFGLVNADIVIDNIHHGFKNNITEINDELINEMLKQALEMLNKR